MAFTTPLDTELKRTRAGRWVRLVKATVLGVFAAAIGGSIVAAEVTTTTTEARVDALFASWATDRQPGGVCAVLRDGKVVYSKGYGMGDLERKIPLTPESVFNLGSVSKQFTAASAGLLVLDGKLSLKADVRTIFPELREQSAPITIGNLVHQTSGMRDYREMFGLSGWSAGQPLNNVRAVALLARQESLQARPGMSFNYSNSNYVLLAEAVHRVSGKSLAQFAQETWFRPLGMSETWFADGVTPAGRRPVVSYRPEGEGYFAYPIRGESYGDGNLCSSVLDLAKWDENFYSGKVGGAALSKLVQTRAELSNGILGDYGFGLFLGHHRGLRIIHHGGVEAGYRCELMRFPDQHFSVIVLCNLSTMNPEDLARRIADIYLEGSFPPTSAATEGGGRKEAKVAADVVAAYAGRYAFVDEPKLVLSVTVAADGVSAQLSGQSRYPVFPCSETEFFYKIVDAQYVFHREADGSVNRVTLHQMGVREAIRITDEPAVPPARYAEYEGSFYSAELDVTYRIVREGEGLVLHTLPMVHAARLTPAYRDMFSVPSGNEPGNFVFVGSASITFRRDARGDVVGFSLSSGRVANVVFSVVRPAPAK